jgi:hypothetical protein
MDSERTVAPPVPENLHVHAWPHGSASRNIDMLSHVQVHDALLAILTPISITLARGATGSLWA